MKEELNKLYGTRLKKIVLYGSYARNEDMSGSDIDLLAEYEIQARNITKEIAEFVIQWTLDCNVI